MSAELSTGWSVWRTYRNHMRVVIEDNETVCRATYDREVAKLREGSVILMRPDGKAELHAASARVCHHGSRSCEEPSHYELPITTSEERERYASVVSPADGSRCVALSVDGDFMWRLLAERNALAAKLEEAVAAFAERDALARLLAAANAELGRCLAEMEADHATLKNSAYLRAERDALAAEVADRKKELKIEIAGKDRILAELEKAFRQRNALAAEVERLSAGNLDRVMQHSRELAAQQKVIDSLVANVEQLRIELGEQQLVIEQQDREIERLRDEQDNVCERCQEKCTHRKEKT